MTVSSGTRRGSGVEDSTDRASPTLGADEIDRLVEGEGRMSEIKLPEENPLAPSRDRSRGAPGELGGDVATHRRLPGPTLVARDHDHLGDRPRIDETEQLAEGAPRRRRIGVEEGLCLVAGEERGVELVG